MLNRDLKFIYYTMYNKNEIICRVFVANTAPSCWPENWSPNNIKPHCLFLGMQPWILVLFSKCLLRIFPHQPQSYLFRKIIWHHKHFTSTDGLSRLDKFRLKRTNFQMYTADKTCLSKILWSRFRWRELPQTVRCISRSQKTKCQISDDMRPLPTHPVKLWTNKWQPSKREHDTAELLYFVGIPFYIGCVLKP